SRSALTSIAEPIRGNLRTRLERNPIAPHDPSGSFLGPPYDQPYPHPPNKFGCPGGLRQEARSRGRLAWWRGRPALQRIWRAVAPEAGGPGPSRPSLGVATW